MDSDVELADMYQTLASAGVLVGSANIISLVSFSRIAYTIQFPDSPKLTGISKIT